MVAGAADGAGGCPRGGQPILDLTLFQNRAYGVGIAIIVGVMTFYSGFLFCMTMFLQSGLGLTPLHAGLTFAPMGLGFALSSLMARPLLMRFGAIVITIGQLLLVLSTVVLLISLEGSGSSTSVWETVAPMILGGLGTGVTLPSLTGVVMSRVPPPQAGVASGVLTTAQQFAQTIGVAALGVIFFNALGAHPDKSAYVRALTVVAGTGIGLTVATLVGTLFLPRVSAPSSTRTRPRSRPYASGPAQRSE